MDTFTGRRAAGSQAWVAFGPASELARVASTGEIVEVTTATSGVARVRVTHLGKQWMHPSGMMVVYGYLEDAAIEPTVIGWVA